jgi:hypothetical protein
MRTRKTESTQLGSPELQRTVSAINQQQRIAGAVAVAVESLEKKIPHLKFLIGVLFRKATPEILYRALVVRELIRTVLGVLRQLELDLDGTKEGWLGQYAGFRRDGI